MSVFDHKQSCLRSYSKGQDKDKYAAAAEFILSFFLRQQSASPRVVSLFALCPDLL